MGDGTTACPPIPIPHSPRPTPLNPPPPWYFPRCTSHRHVSYHYPGDSMLNAGDADSIVDIDRNQSGGVSRRRVLQGALGAVAGVAEIGRAAAQDAATPVPSPSGQIRIFPMPGSKTHSHLTQISFRGEGLQSLGPVSVEGSVSGAHSGIQVRHSDGNGVSWMPDF